MEKQQEAMTMLREKQKGNGIEPKDDGMLISVMEKFSPRRQTHVSTEHRVKSK